VLLLQLCLALPPVPNNVFWGSGYNPYIANPHPTTPGNGADPGWQAYVFDMSKCSNYTSPDGQYCVPIGVDLLPCDFCTFDTASLVEEGTNSYQKSLSQQITFKSKSILDIIPIAFGGSYDFKQVLQESSEYKNVFEDTTVQCCSFKVDISPFIPPPLSSEFIAALHAAPLEYDSSYYIKLLNYFGLLVPSSMTTGALFGVRSTFLTTGWSQMQSTTRDMTAYASANLWIFSAAASAMTQEQVQMAHTYQRFVNDTSIYSYGGKLPANGSVAAWLDTVYANSLPLTTDFMYISDLMDPFYISDFNATELKIIQANTINCMSNDYCKWLESEAVVFQCTGLGPDNPLPPKSIFGGIYQVDDCGKDNVDNTFTSAMACPEEYAPSFIGRVFAPESSCGAAQYLCLLIGIGSDGQHNYGGGYQLSSQQSKDFQNRNNPLTGSTSCPAGFTTVLSGTSNNRAGGGIPALTINQYSCLNTSHIPTYESIGGFYSVDDKKTTHTVNTFTNAPSCPVNYCAVQIGRVLIGEIGGTQFVCIACNLLNTT
jgi:hypothetical protein